MRVLVIGGTAFMGPHIVRELHAEGHQVTVFNRGQTPCELPEGVQRIYGDRRRLGEFAPELQRNEPQVVLDMMLTTQEQARTLMEVFRDTAGRVVAASSGDVYRAYGVMIGIEAGPSEPLPLKENASLRTQLYPYRGETRRAEDDPQRWLDDYEKILVERTILGDPELTGTILRLPMVHGPGDRQHRIHAYLKRMDDGRETILLEEGLASWRVTRGYVQDIAWGIKLAVTDEGSAGQIYNVGDREAYTTREWVGYIGECSGWQGEIITLPLDDHINDCPSDLHPGFNTAQDLVYDTSRIRSELGYAERVNLQEGLQRTIAWERAHPPENIPLSSFDYEAEDHLLERLYKK